MSPEHENFAAEAAYRALKLDEAIDAVSEPYVEGPVTVAYDQPSWETSQAWVRAGCSEHGTTVVMRASGRSHMRYLAFVLKRYYCPPGGHDDTATAPAPEDPQGQHPQAT